MSFDDHMEVKQKHDTTEEDGTHKMEVGIGDSKWS